MLFSSNAIFVKDVQKEYLLLGETVQKSSMHLNEARYWM